MDRVKGFTTGQNVKQWKELILTEEELSRMDPLNVLDEIGDLPLSVLERDDGELCRFANNYINRFYSEYCDAFEYMLLSYDIEDLSGFKPDWDKYPVATCLYYDGLKELRALLKRIIISSKDDLHQLFGCLRSVGAFLELPYCIDEDAEVVLLDSVDTLQLLLEAEGLVHTPYREFALRKKPGFDDSVIFNKDYQLAA